MTGVHATTVEIAVTSRLMDLIVPYGRALLYPVTSG
jgi:hypothetical protein